MALSYHPDDHDVLVFCDKLRERIAFRGRIDRQRATLRDELKALNWPKAIMRTAFLGVLILFVAVLVSATS